LLGARGFVGDGHGKPVEWTSSKSSEGTNSFIDELFHKGILIITRALHPSGDKLETLLSIFNPFYQTENPHIMSVNEALPVKQPKRLDGLRGTSDVKKPF